MVSFASVAGGEQESDAVNLVGFVVVEVVFVFPLAGSGVGVVPDDDYGAVCGALYSLPLHIAHP